MPAARVDRCHSTRGRFKAIVVIIIVIINIIITTIDHHHYNKRKGDVQSLLNNATSLLHSQPEAMSLVQLSQVITVTVKAKKFLSDTLKAWLRVGHTGRNV